MEVTERHVFALDDSSRSGEVRRTATALATRLGATQQEVGRIALVATEAVSNAVKHATSGQLLLYGTQHDGAWSVGMVAVDRGPGMHDLGACFEDGMSTAGSPGTGLGAMRRLATTFDIHTSPGGTVVFAEVASATRQRHTPQAFTIGALRVPYPGEEVCGDDLAVMPLGEGRCMVLVVDGLGHGLEAATAAEEATRLFRAHPGSGPEAVMALLHDGLRGTRGAAAAVAELDLRTRTVRFVGVGNIAGFVRGAASSQGMVSHHGTLGHQALRMREFRYSWPEDALVVLHSDGLSARWDLASYPGLAGRHPMVIAAVLYRDHARRTDDASIVVLREAA